MMVTVGDTEIEEESHSQNKSSVIADAESHFLVAVNLPPLLTTELRNSTVSKSSTCRAAGLLYFIFIMVMLVDLFDWKDSLLVLNTFF